MTVKRIVANIGPVRPSEAMAFYGDILGMEIVMDHGWIVTFAGAGSSRPEVSFAEEGGSGTPVPDLSIEVDDLDAVLGALSAAGIPIEYGPVSERWGVRRLYVRDPFGRLVNILAHADTRD
ncbi:VOC family protein [Kaistia geumhonensis]|uniref:Catechol 2,3-dioxygenase-like lactoylglutathione lyase family enzyme n=1 Tax=Kaistia geumhonensis TaxID=410839 RepID=A0ABU0MAJ3_9HYPH|nr:VOC family protein [Kaistia geumhonensis]MCX5480931.1 VOC family protein [Kaistia geumhonensis]MDQ0517988.1 catechol 2,3-dioxygenase-like lactoylglutathione lyase family enzyme [Kaistia geumhonensis]